MRNKPGGNIMSPIRIGDMDTPVVLRTYTASVNDFAEETLAWADGPTLWALVTYPTRDRAENESGHQPTIFQAVDFTVRALGLTVNEKMRLKFGSDEYDILNIVPIGRDGHYRIETTLRK